mmetsp:Transcript_9116/g.23180  ORF Transcript_9116/g.23180 Transcript_9116/m.23180 type:complete len:460 (+) Transcript_9116:211-1590(+)
MMEAQALSYLLPKIDLTVREMRLNPIRHLSNFGVRLSRQRKQCDLLEWRVLHDTVKKQFLAHLTMLLDLPAAFAAWGGMQDLLFQVHSRLLELRVHSLNTRKIAFQRRKSHLRSEEPTTSDWSRVRTRSGTSKVMRCDHVLDIPAFLDQCLQIDTCYQLLLSLNKLKCTRAEPGHAPHVRTLPSSSCQHPNMLECGSQHTRGSVTKRTSSLESIMFTAAEDDLLFRGLHFHGHHYSAIRHALLQLKSERLVMFRLAWLRFADFNNALRIKRYAEVAQVRGVSRRWLHIEDKLLALGVAEHGFQWTMIELKLFPHRTKSELRRRWTTIAHRCNVMTRYLNDDPEDLPKIKPFMSDVTDDLCPFLSCWAHDTKATCSASSFSLNPLLLLEPSFVAQSEQTTLAPQYEDLSSDDEPDDSGTASPWPYQRTLLGTSSWMCTEAYLDILVTSSTYARRGNSLHS